MKLSKITWPAVATQLASAGTRIRRQLRLANTGHFLPRHKAGAPTRNKPSREEWKFTTHCSTDRGQGVLGDSRQGAAHLGSCLKLDFYLNLLKGRQGR